MTALKSRNLKPTLRRMGDVPDQPFVCELCHVIFGSAKALDSHLQEPHKKWELTPKDKAMLKSFWIKIDE